MKIVIIGGTGRIGSRVVALLREQRHQAMPASPDSGVNTHTGQGLADVLLRARQDPRVVVADPHARYFGTELSERTLVPSADAKLGEIRFEDWLAQAAVHAAPA